MPVGAFGKHNVFSKGEQAQVGLGLALASIIRAGRPPPSKAERIYTSLCNVLDTCEFS